MMIQKSVKFMITEVSKEKKPLHMVTRIKMIGQHIIRLFLILERFKVPYSSSFLPGYALGLSAYEPRIKRVIASSIAYDYMKIPPAYIENFVRWLLKHPKIMEPAARIKMKIIPQENWGAVNLMYITKKDNSPIEASKVLLEFNSENIKSELVTQDILILTGAEDHLISLKMHYMQVKALKNARSVTDYIFTREEQGQNHCQVGNIGLALKVMSGWIKEKE